MCSWVNVLGVMISPINFEDAIHNIKGWTQNQETKYIYQHQPIAFVNVRRMLYSNQYLIGIFEYLCVIALEFFGVDNSAVELWDIIAYSGATPSENFGFGILGYVKQTPKHIIHGGR